MERLVADNDLLACLKQFTDVLVVGRAHSTHGAVHTLDTGVELGAAKKVVRVFGERRIELGSEGRIGFSAPERFAALDLTWDNAYGGRDEYAEGLTTVRKNANGSLFPIDVEEVPGVLSYPRNAAGRGFYVDVLRERLQGQRVPNLEDPEDPVLPERMIAKHALDWIDRPSAAGYGPIDVFTFPRAAYFIRPDYSPALRTIREIKLGAVEAENLLDRDLFTPPNPRMHNCAPAGLAVCRLEGKERVKLWHMHPLHGLFEFNLPGDIPQITVVPPNTKSYVLVPCLQTVLLEPDHERMTLTWAGKLQTATVFPREMLATLPYSVAWILRAIA